MYSSNNLINKKIRLFLINQLINILINLTTRLLYKNLNVDEK